MNSNDGFTEVQNAEVLPVDGLVDTLNEVLPQDGLSTKVDTKKKKVLKTTTIPVQPTESMMSYLGTVIPDGMVGRKNSKSVASYPVVLFNEYNVPTGVLVLSDPGMLGIVLCKQLEDSGYTNFTIKESFSLDRLTKLAALKAVLSANDPLVDVQQVSLTLA